MAEIFLQKVTDVRRDEPKGMWDESALNRGGGQKMRGGVVGAREEAGNERS